MEEGRESENTITVQDKTGEVLESVEFGNVLICMSFIADLYVCCPRNII